MHVIFVEPRFPANQRQFVRGLHEAGAAVTGIGEAPAEALGPELRGWLAGYEQVRSVVDADALTAAVKRVQARGWVDRLEATVEAHIEAAAQAREACGIPGTTVRTAFLCRDKPAMKEALRAAGIPCARSTSARSGDDVRRFARENGYPLIVKPASAAGASGTMRVDEDAGLEDAIRRSHVDHGAHCAVEEFIEGHEGFYDTLSINGEVVHDFASHYYPGVLEAMRARWISPQIAVTNRVDTSVYDEVREMARRVNRALGIGTSATHMEWFFGPKGLKFSEIGCRPPGVCVWDLYSAANDFDLYREWGHAITHGRPSQRPSRRYSAGMIALRPDRDGRISHYDGVDAVQHHFGEWILDMHLPPPGTPTQPVEAGYMANAWVRFRHPDFDGLRGMMDAVGRTLKVRASD
jgi:formate-dependent phosphoribosylglycinamide formyltransferase (GAR transformylase)